MRVIVGAEVPRYNGSGSFAPGFIDFEFNSDFLEKLNKAKEFMESNGSLTVSYFLEAKVYSYAFKSERKIVLNEILEDPEDFETSKLDYGRLIITRNGDIHLTGSTFYFGGEITSQESLTLQRLMIAMESRCLVLVSEDEDAN
jgi:hypothetical protein